VRAIGQRQAGALTVLWVLHPLSVRGRVLGEVLNPGESSTHARRSLASMALRDLITSPMVVDLRFDSLRALWKITNAGIFALRRYALSRGAMTVEVVG
jgi:hypothetical protein